MPLIRQCTVQTRYPPYKYRAVQHRCTKPVFSQVFPLPEEVLAESVHLLQLAADGPPQGLEQVSQTLHTPLDHAGIPDCEGPGHQDVQEGLEVRTELLLEVSGQRRQELEHGLQ